MSKLTLYSITPLPSMDDKSIENVLSKSSAILMDVVSGAYISSGHSVHIVEDPIKEGWQEVNSSWLIPLDENDNVSYCYQPDVLRLIEKDVASEGFEIDRGMPGIGGQGCVSNFKKRGFIYTANGENGWGLPDGDFIIQIMHLPAIFPYERLHSQESNIYLYHAAFGDSKDMNLHAYKENKLYSKLDAFYKDKMLTKTSYVKDLSTGEVLPFGTPQK